jgi:tetratricopeptide (TPR) repeat protein
VAEDKKTIIKMAYIYSQEGRWDKAILEYKKLLALDPADNNVHTMLGDAQAKKGAAQEAFTEYQLATEAYNKQGQQDKAGVVYRKMARLDTKALDEPSRKRQVLLQKQVEAEAALETDDIETAIKAFGQVIKLSPESYDVYQKLGELYMRSGDMAEAARNLLVIAEAYYRSKIYKKALPIFLKVLEADPKNSSAHLALGEIYLKDGNESDAKREFLLISEVALEDGDLDKAQLFAQKAIQLKSLEAYYLLGQVYYRHKKYEEAKLEFEKLLKFKVNHVGALDHMAEIGLSTDKLDEAQGMLNRVFKVEPGNAWGLSIQAQLHEKRGKNEEAAASFVLAGKALQTAGDEDKAKQAFTHALKLDPGSADAQQALHGAQRPKPAAEAAPAPMAAPPAPVLTEAPGPQLDEALPATALPHPDPSELVIPHTAPIAGTSVEDEEHAMLMQLAEGYVSGGSLDEAIEVYQRILNNAPDDKAARQALHHVYSLIAKQSTGEAPMMPGLTGDSSAAAAEFAKTAEAARAEAQARRREQEELDAKLKAEEGARLMAEAEARQRAEEESRLRAEAEARIRAEEDARLRAETESRLKAEIEAKLKSEMEAKIKAEMEAKLKAEDARMKAAEEGLRRAEESRKAAEEAASKAEELRHKAEEAARKLEAEAKARHEDAAHKHAEGATPAHAPHPHAPMAAADEEELDEFTTVTVAEIYTKQGLIEEAQRIYQRILAKEPGNADVAAKLEALKSRHGGKAASKPAGALPPLPALPDPAKKSKVSYL